LTPVTVPAQASIQRLTFAIPKAIIAIGTIHAACSAVSELGILKLNLLSANCAAA